MVKWFRYLLTALLIYGVYTETGIWTAIFVTLISVTIELFEKAINDICYALKIKAMFK